VGMNQGFITGRERANGVDAGRNIGRTETALEVTYADTFGRLTVQPDLQYIIRPAGDRDIDNALVATMRLLSRNLARSGALGARRVADQQSAGGFCGGRIASCDGLG